MRRKYFSILFLLFFSTIFLFLVYLKPKEVRASPGITTVSFQVSASHDDAGDHYNPSGYWEGWHLDKSRIQPGHFSPEGDGTYKYGGVRFINVNIPQGAIIVSAILRYCADTSCEGTGARWYVYGQDDSNPVEFSTFDDFLARPQTTAATDTGFWPAWVADTWYETPDISSVIQEIVNRPDWNSGNPLALLFYGHPQARTTHEIRTCDANPAEATILEVQYTTEAEVEYAEYNATLGAPDCHGGSPCIANSSLLQCCGNQPGGPEPNQPNTINGDVDASSGTCHSDESVENITVESLDHNYMGQEDHVRVSVTIYCWGTTDRWAICYTNDSSTADWVMVAGGTSTCSGSGFETKTVTFTLDNIGGKHAVRGINRYGTAITVCSYSDTSYNDFDDLAFEIYTGGPPPDITAPTYSSSSINSTEAGKPTNFTLDWTDDNGLSGYIFSTNNTGRWFNTSFTSFSGTANTAWYVTTLNDTVEALVQWRFYANDTSNNWNTSQIYDTITTFVETEPPKYFDISTNSTLAGTAVLFSLKWTDNIGLDKGILSLDNCTGNFVNQTWQNLSGTIDWLNDTYIINSTLGCTIRWKAYTNDTCNNWNVTDVYSYVTTAEAPTTTETAIQVGATINPVTQYYNTTIWCDYRNATDNAKITDATVKINAGGSNITIPYNSSSDRYDYVYNSTVLGSREVFCYANRTGYESNSISFNLVTQTIVSEECDWTCEDWVGYIDDTGWEEEESSSSSPDEEPVPGTEKTFWFRKHITIPHSVNSIFLNLTYSDNINIYINSNLIPDPLASLYDYNITDYIDRDRTNLITVKVWAFGGGTVKFGGDMRYE